MRCSHGSVSHFYANWDKKLIRSVAESQEGDVFSPALWDSLLKTPPRESERRRRHFYLHVDRKSVSTFKAAPESTALCLSSQSEFKLD